MKFSKNGLVSVVRLSGMSGVCRYVVCFLLSVFVGIWICICKVCTYDTCMYVCLYVSNYALHCIVCECILRYVSYVKRNMYADTCNPYGQHDHPTHNQQSNTPIYQYSRTRTHRRIGHSASNEKHSHASSSQCWIYPSLPSLLHAS